MVRIRVNEKQPDYKDLVLDATSAWDDTDRHRNRGWDRTYPRAWVVTLPNEKYGGHKAIFLDSEVRVLGKHEGEYDPNHWGELDPDAYDRHGYNSGAGRHLLDTGVN